MLCECTYTKTPDLLFIKECCILAERMVFYKMSEQYIMFQDLRILLLRYSYLVRDLWYFFPRRQAS